MAKQSQLVKIEMCSFCSRVRGSTEVFFGNVRARMIYDAKYMDHVRICPECARRALEQETLCLPAPSVKAEHKQTPEWIERHL